MKTEKEKIEEARQSFASGGMSIAEADAIICKSISKTGAAYCYFFQRYAGLLKSIEYQLLADGETLREMFKEYDSILKLHFGDVRKWGKVCRELKGRAVVVSGDGLEVIESDVHFDSVEFLWKLGKRFLTAVKCIMPHLSRLEKDAWERQRKGFADAECAFRKLKELFWEISGEEGSVLEFIESNSTAKPQK